VTFRVPGDRSVYVIGSGLVTCLGQGLAAQVPALRSGRAPQPRIIDTVQGQAPYHAVDGGSGRDRVYSLLEQAIGSALHEAALDTPSLRQTALVIGSSCLDLPVHESIYLTALDNGESPTPIVGPGYGTMAANLAARFGIDGPQYTLSTACSSSANALLHARLLITAGLANHVLVVGIEAYNRVSVEGFGALLLQARGEYAPFDKDRTGLILGEGAAAVVLSGTAPGELKSSSTMLCGGASACDSSSPTSSHPDRILSVMERALLDAGVRADELIGIKAHGTGTVSNDQAEGEALRRLRAPLPPFTSLKPFVGHTLGACGLVELLMLTAAWNDGFLPATPGFSAIDPGIGVAPATSAVPLADHGAVLCNFFGFGGNNTSLVVAR
jgi:3-oxoacyl-[acyl-carrier-protein] synthase-1